MAEAKADLHLATEFLKDSYVLELRGYTGNNVHYILDLLKPPRLEAVSTSGLRSSPEVVSGDVIVPTSVSATVPKTWPGSASVVDNCFSFRFRTITGNGFH